MLGLWGVKLICVHIWHVFWTMRHHNCQYLEKNDLLPWLTIGKTFSRSKFQSILFYQKYYSLKVSSKSGNNEQMANLLCKFENNMPKYDLWLWLEVVTLFKVKFQIGNLVLPTISWFIPWKFCYNWVVGKHMAGWKSPTPGFWTEEKKPSHSRVNIVQSIVTFILALAHCLEDGGWKMKPMNQMMSEIFHFIK